MIKVCLLLGAVQDDAGGPDPFVHSGARAAPVLEARLPAAIGYVQSRRLSAQVEAGPALPVYRGAAEIYFGETEPAWRLATRPEMLAELWGPNTSIKAVIVGRQRTVMRLPAYYAGERIKGMFVFRRKPGMTVDAFQRHWWRVHGPIAARTQDALGYEQCHVLERLYTQREPCYHGVTEIHWPNAAAAGRAMTSRQMVEEQAGDAAHFVEPGSVELFLAEEETVIAS